MTDFTDPIRQPIDTQPTSVNTADTGDAMIKRLDGFFDRLGGGHLGYMYNYWLDRSCADPALKANRIALLGAGPEKQQLDELRQLNWGAMWGRMQRLENLGKSCGAVPAALDHVGSEVHNAWKTTGGGEASDAFTKAKADATAAQETFSKLHSSLETLRASSRNIVDAVTQYATKDAPQTGKQFMDWYGDEDKLNVGDQCSATDNLQRAVDGAYDPGDDIYSNGSNWSEDATKHIWDKKLTPDYLTHTPGIYQTRGDNFYCNDKIKYLNEFSVNYQNTVTNFRKQVDNAHSTIAGLMRELQSTVSSANLDPFGKLTTSPQQPEPKPNPKPKPEHKGNGTTTTTSDQSGTTTSSTDTSGQQTQQTQQPDVPPRDTSTGQPGQGNGTPTVPVGTPGQPGNGQGTPTVPTQPTVPSQPTAPTQPSGQPETVTVQGPNGQRIQMTSPDGQGHMKLTIDDGSGKPKSYDVNFGSGGGVQPGGGSVPGQPGHYTPGGSQPGQPGQPGQGGEQQVRADQSGHAVIHNGKETITIDRSPTDPGEVKVTVDDGSGKPTTYTLDSSGGTSQSGTGGEMTPGGTGSGGEFGGGTTGTTGSGAADFGGGSTGGSDLGGGSADFGGGSSGGGGGDALTSPANAMDGGPGVAAMASPDSGQLSPGGMSGADPSMTGHAGVADAPAAQGAPGAGAPGVAAAPGGQGGGGGEMGGMPMMGGMGGMGQGGGDAEHGGGQWRTEGDLFDDIGLSVAAEIAEALTDFDNDVR